MAYAIITSRLPDMGHAVRRIYYSGEVATVPTRQHMQVALDTIARCYLPSDAHDTFALLAALNLLNAIIKLPWGRSVLTYSYIKTTVAQLYDYLATYPVAGVSIYHDADKRITYFSVMGVQVSFHYVNFTHAPRHLGTRQTWDGIRLQLIGVELLELALSLLRPRTMATTQVILSTQAKARPHHEPGDGSLALALSFNLWRTEACTLFRRRDQRPLRVMRFTGSNETELNSFLKGSHNLIPTRPHHELFAGIHYTVGSQMRIVAIHPRDYIRLLCQYNHLISGKQHCNLLLTYGLARHLTRCIPTLRFVCTLITNRISIRNRVFTHAMLCRVPLNSRMRRLKVWMPYDPNYVLQHFDIGELPQNLVDEYMATEDYYEDYEIIERQGLKGLYAYRRHHLLPPVYLDIVVRNFHAYVQRADGRWAIYSLGRECFVTDFIYSRIWYDRRRGIIYGNVGSTPTVIYQFF